MMNREDPSYGGTLAVYAVTTVFSVLLGLFIAMVFNRLERIENTLNLPNCGICSPRGAK